MKAKVCHLTSVHPPKDGRIFYKECTSLAAAGYDVTLIAAGADNEVCNGVKIVGVEKSPGRLGRMLKTTRRVYRKALEVDADIYHIHDPELLPYALKLQRRGKKVIFDSHEDVPGQIRAKEYIHTVIRGCIANGYQMFEKFICKRLSGLVTVTPHIVNRLKKINLNTILVTNFPKVSEEEIIRPQQKISPSFVAYVGPIDPQWNINTIVDCVGDSKHNCRLLMAGASSNKEYFDSLELSPGWPKTDYKGKVHPDEVKLIYSKAVCGFALLQPSFNTNGNSGTIGNTKLFEIMLAGIPVICTNFELWKEIVEDNAIGICVNPNDRSEIIQAIDYIIANPDLARQMGENGRRAVLTKYNWESEAKKLVDFYNSLI